MKSFLRNAIITVLIYLIGILIYCILGFIVWQAGLILINAFDINFVWSYPHGFMTVVLVRMFFGSPSKEKEECL